MRIATLEKKLKSLEAPVDNELLRWLYLHLPPQPIKSREMHRGYSEAIRILMRESGSLDADSRTAVGQHLNWLRTVDAIKKMLALSDEDKEKVGGGDAMRLFGLSGNGIARR